MKITTTITSLVVSLVLPVSAMALPPFPKGTLQITNNTKHDVTSKIDGNCSSSLLGNAGITKAGETSKISPTQILLACASSLLQTNTLCNATVYPSNNCSGNPIAKVTLDTQTGIKQVETSADYIIDANGFTVSVAGGPQFASR